MSAEALHEEEVLGKAYDTRLLRRLWGSVRPYRLQVALTLALVAPMFVLEATPAWIVKTGLDRVIASPESATPPGDAASPGGLVRLLDAPAGIAPLLWLAALYGAVMILSAGMTFVHMLLMATTGQCAMRDLRRDVFRHIQ